MFKHKSPTNIVMQHFVIHFNFASKNPNPKWIRKKLSWIKTKLENPLKNISHLLRVCVCVCVGMRE